MNLVFHELETGNSALKAIFYINTALKRCIFLCLPLTAFMMKCSN